MYMTPYKFYNFKRKINKHVNSWRGNRLLEIVNKVFNKKTFENVHFRASIPVLMMIVISVMAGFQFNQ